MTKTVEDMLTRDTAILKNIDPKGRKIIVRHIKGSALYEVGVEDGPNFGGHLPEELSGKWTHPNRVQDEIKKYLEKMWDENDAHVEKMARKAHASKVAKKEEKLAASTG